MNDEQKKVFLENTARNMKGVEEFIKIRHIGNCFKADPDYGRAVADACGITYEKAGIKIKKT
ncbi:MAG: catalase-related domain-containing protein [Paludibacteraceae bacterium]